DVVVGRVLNHVIEGRFFLGVAPLFKFRDGQRESFIELGIDDVHEGNVGDDHLEEIGAHVGDCAHQQAARGAAFDDDAVARAVLGGDEVLGAGDEVGEGVQLVHHAAGVVPGFAHFAAAADVHEGHDYAAVEERNARGAESDWKAETVG